MGGAAVVVVAAGLSSVIARFRLYLSSCLVRLVSLYDACLVVLVTAVAVGRTLAGRRLRGSGRASIEPC